MKDTRNHPHPACLSAAVGFSELGDSARYTYSGREKGERGEGRACA